MPQDTTAIQQRYSFRQDSEPSGAPDAATWINPTGGASGNNVERYTYNRESDVWELVSSVGPDTPTRETVGATWRDTGNAVTKVYDGNSFVNLSPATTSSNTLQSGYYEEVLSPTSDPQTFTFNINESYRIGKVEWGGFTRPDFGTNLDNVWLYDQYERQVYPRYIINQNNQTGTQTFYLNCVLDRIELKTIGTDVDITWNMTVYEHTESHTHPI